MSSADVIPIVTTVISLGVFLVALLTLNWRLRRDRRENEERIQQQLKETIDTFEERIALRIGQVDDKRREDVRALHDRIYELENRTFAVLTDRLGNVEKEMSGIKEAVKGNTHILHIIQENYIKGEQK